MTLLAAIHDQLDGYAPLTDLVPTDRLYTGLPPIRDATGQTITPPYVALSTQTTAVVSRTSSGTRLCSELIRFSVYSASYDNVRQIAQSIADRFAGFEFDWSRGRVLDGRLGDREEAEDPDDGVWRVAQDIQFLLTDNGGP